MDSVEYIGVRRGEIDSMTDTRNTEFESRHIYGGRELHADPSLWLSDYTAFDQATEQFYRKEIDAKTYKGISGGFGSYAQRGAEANMLRLRLPGGRIDRKKLKFLADSVKKYQVTKVHVTTCQTVQFHNLSGEDVCVLAREAVEHGIITRGGGGDFPRNTMVSPLSGVEKGEYFDVLPYALVTSDFLLGYIHGPKMPRKLKVGFSNSPANLTHATYRDLGFVAREDGCFDVYSAGGLGLNAKIGVRVAERVEPDQILYYVEAMHEMFLTYGNYENRAKARSRYMQDTLGGSEAYRDAFLEKLRAVYESGRNLDLILTDEKKKLFGEKKADGEIPESKRVIAQKQEGLCAVVYHPVGGCPNPEFFERIYETVREMDQVELRIAPDESIYIINCTGKESKRVLACTADGAETEFSCSVACIGSSICQQGLRDSQRMLQKLVEMERREGFADGVLPKIHISGCPSSCGTHQTGVVGLRGAAKKVDGEMQIAFQLTYGGCDLQNKEKMGELLGTLSEDQVIAFFEELGHRISETGLTFEIWQRQNPDLFEEIAMPYTR